MYSVHASHNCGIHVCIKLRQVNRAKAFIRRFSRLQPAQVIARSLQRRAGAAAEIT